MGTTPLFSVIMPVYKVERYLAKAIESVLKQSYANLELILVDDCSPDTCGSICDAYAGKDDRVRVIHKPQNEGLGFARNTGLSVCTGEYVLFIDSDDWLEKDTLEKAAAYMEETSPCILAFGFAQDYYNKKDQLVKRDIVQLKPRIAQTAYDIACAAVEMDWQRNFSYAWSKVYSRAFLEKNRLLFDDTKLMEDFVFNIAAFEKAEKIRVVPDVFYHYIRPAHITLASAYDAKFFALCKTRYQKEYDLLCRSGVEKHAWHYQAVRDIFIKHILAVVIRNFNQSAGLSFREQYGCTKTILNDPQTVQILEQSVTKSKSIQILQTVFRHRWILATLVLARLYYITQRLQHLFHLGRKGT